MQFGAAELSRSDEYVDKVAEDGISLEENRATFQRIKLRTRFLNAWSKRDLSTEIFGKRIELPFGITPTVIAE